MLQIGPYTIETPVVLAPMAGVTDLPFRRLCSELGAGLVVSEMVTSDTRLWNTRKSRLRLDHSGEAEPRSVQIAGGDPEQMAEAARQNHERGAQIIDINFGCPAKKVCNKAAGSALMRDEKLVQEILHAVRKAVDIPVTVKMRTGWSPENRNAINIARIAEDAGINALSVHGRTRACMYRGEAEYETIAAVKQAVSIPVIANGDITCAEKAQEVFSKTGADAVMVGRAAQGRPWIFREIAHYLETGEHLSPPSTEEVEQILLSHVGALHSFYGEYTGVRVARKHVGWYLQARPNNDQVSESSADPVGFRKQFNALEDPEAQVEAITTYFACLKNGEDIAA
ncbi:tRNA dihydrouridine synthase DusB [Spongorhabdus nitratireducens]